VLGVDTKRSRSDLDLFRSFTVAATCDVCGKGPGFGMSVSHSHRRTRRKWLPNIQTVRVAAGGGNTKKVNACTSCIKAQKVVPGA
jgi:large subunit ribosomal protein L28